MHYYPFQLSQLITIALPEMTLKGLTCHAPLLRRKNLAASKTLRNLPD
ncbi:hypothetical protein COO91_07860 [Nostoc flagelliforme CCNUN1]|uniref:Uncharacterized protein n=1 Tax=Nostoc flagelliforme CCNUN1 TaxID=2038116 RepID=A0A2K8T298_9NOSO|nr:hypothetical protein COO91_07860 [Nostoc flagelliforme CCNUN1]